MTFEEDLTKRRIDVAAFAAGDPNRFAEWQQMYAQMHPNSFYMLVKMVLNDVRRRFWLAEAVKPIAAPITEAPAKPAVRRAAIPGAPKPTAAPTPESTSTEPTAETPTSTPAPPKARPVIRRPVITASTETPPVVPETNIPAAAPATPPEAPAEAPKAPRPRPVFRKPAAPADNAAEPVADTTQVAQAGTNSELPFHTNPDPAAAAPKAPRPRPVIKRPTALQNPSNQPGTQTPVEPAATEETKATPVQPETTGTDATPSAPKPPRPRPIFKRPATALTEEKNEESNEAVSNPAPVAPVSEIVPPVELSGEAATPTEQMLEPVAAKPPRPRPIIRRPTPPAAESTVPAEPTSEVPVTPAPETPPTIEPIAPEPIEEPRKPPRPRPIFKRPTKPEEPGELI
ncbi:hypothetical protein [Adhaeribacter rhizoryzae]|uniref:Uncharacterized protein n=1 Tax=Adhaeribacter rhizoryzae TaxID=2607907 RepID=A0A5M6DP49_9BACT|nr:hypothetical protein [Adhaeribacter rhizoryzae]KAA5549277.1 hypothetical protein F0145_01390 [Adhaeribacter rhizoryzae]